MTRISVCSDIQFDAALLARTECDKTKVAGIGTVALPIRPADHEAGGSGTAATWACPIRHGAAARSANEFYGKFINKLP